MIQTAYSMNMSQMCYHQKLQMAHITIGEEARMKQLNTQVKHQMFWPSPGSTYTVTLDSLCYTPSTGGMLYCLFTMYVFSHRPKQII
jgi:hypothetical protein